MHCILLSQVSFKLLTLCNWFSVASQKRVNQGAVVYRDSCLSMLNKKIVVPNLRQRQCIIAINQKRDVKFVYVPYIITQLRSHLHLYFLVTLASFEGKCLNVGCYFLTMIYVCTELLSKSFIYYRSMIY